MLNRVTLIGNVGGDPESRDVGDAHQVATFSLATSYSFRDGEGQRQEATDWHQVVAWDRDAANVAQLVRKGDLLFVEGRLDYDVWKDRRSGQDRREARVRLTSWRKIHSPGTRRNAAAAGDVYPGEPESAAETAAPDVGEVGDMTDAAGTSRDARGES